MLLAQPCHTAVLIATLLSHPYLTVQTYNNNLFDYPSSLITLRVLPDGRRLYTYPDGTPVNDGASSSTDPFSELTLAPGYTTSLDSQYPLTHFIPVLWSAPVLEAFYLSVFQRAAGEFWAGTSVRPTKGITISAGQLHLTFVSSPELNWAVIMAFAWNMWQAARRGFTVGYQCYIKSPTGQSTLVVMSVSQQPMGDGIMQDFAPQRSSAASTKPVKPRATEVVGNSHGSGSSGWREPELVTDDERTESDEEWGVCKKQCFGPPRHRARRKRTNGEANVS